MTSSTDSERADSGDERPPFDGLSDLSRYDLVLLSIPFTFLVPLLGSSLFGIPVHHAIFTGGVLAVAILVDAIYRNPPTGGHSGRVGS